MTAERRTGRIEPASDEVLRAYLAQELGLKDAIDEAIETYPSSIRVMARDPELVRAFMELVRVIQYRDTRVERGLLWLVGHVASRAGDCPYCVARIEAVGEFETSPVFSEAERAALRFARAAGSQPVQLTDAHFDELRRFYEDDEIIEIASFICIYAFANRWNDIFGSVLEEKPLAFATEHVAKFDVNSSLSRVATQTA
jgi:alkylhydroperoxidase family enzyme